MDKSFRKPKERIGDMTEIMAEMRAREMTFAEIGAIFHTSRQRVYQILKRAADKKRKEASSE